MTRRRLGVSIIAVATVGACLPVLTASAAVPQRLVLAQEDTRTTAAAGTCTAFTLTATDAVSATPDAATYTVTLTEDPSNAANDVDFCTVADGTPFAAAPRYSNEPTLLAVDGTVQPYQAGQTTTPPAAGAVSGPNNPDSAGDVSAQNDPQFDDANTNNPSGQDAAAFRVNGGVVRVGVVGLTAGSAAPVNALVDEGTAFTRHNDADAALEDAARRPGEPGPHPAARAGRRHRAGRAEPGLRRRRDGRQRRPGERRLRDFVENGPGTFVSGTAGTGAISSRAVLTDGVGRATVRLVTSVTDTNSVLAAITTPAGTRCQEPATATTAAGQCTDTSAVTLGPAASPSSSASPSPSASPVREPSSTVATSPSPRPGSSTRGTRAVPSSPAATARCA